MNSRLIWGVLAGCIPPEEPPSTLAPAIQFAGIADGDSVVAGQELTLRATASDADHRGADLSSIWTLDGVPTCDDDSLAADGSTSCDFVFVEGVHTVSVQVTDPDGLSATTELSVSAAFDNRPPTITSLTLGPSEPTVESTLSCQVLADDPDGDPLTYSFVWTVNDEGLASNFSTLSGVFAKDDTVSCTATATDGELASSPSSSPLLVIRNASPSAPDIGILPLEPNEHELDLTCILYGVSSDPDGDPVDYEISWHVDDTPFFGATTQTRPGDTVPAEELDQGEHWQCGVKAYDGDGGASSTTTTVIIEP